MCQRLAKPLLVGLRSGDHYTTTITEATVTPSPLFYYALLTDMRAKLWFLCSLVAYLFCFL